MVQYASRHGADRRRTGDLVVDDETNRTRDMSLVVYQRIRAKIKRVINKGAFMHGTSCRVARARYGSGIRERKKAN